MLLESRVSALLSPPPERSHCWTRFTQSGLLLPSSISVGFAGGQENRDFPQPIKIESRARGCNSIGSCKPSMQKALGSIPSAGEKRKEKKRQRDGLAVKRTCCS